MRFVPLRSGLMITAMEHRTFLMETLKQVKRQLEVPETLLESTGAPPNHY